MSKVQDFFFGNFKSATRNDAARSCNVDTCWKGVGMQIVCTGQDSKSKTHEYRSLCSLSGVTAKELEDTRKKLK